MRRQGANTPVDQRRLTGHVEGKRRDVRRAAPPHPVQLRVKDRDVDRAQRPARIRLAAHLEVGDRQGGEQDGGRIGGGWGALLLLASSFCGRGGQKQQLVEDAAQRLDRCGGMHQPRIEQPVGLVFDPAEVGVAHAAHPRPGIRGGDRGSDGGLPMLYIFSSTQNFIILIIITIIII